MCGSSRPRIPPTPAMPTPDDVGSGDELLQARRDVRKRLKGAMNTQKTLLSPDFTNEKKTLLGQ